MNKDYLNNLAKVAVKIGVNLQKNQYLTINAPIECSDFARKISKIAFEEGAKDVYINYSDEQLSKIRYDYADISVFKELPDWFVDKQQEILDKKMAIISIYAEDPDLLAEVDPLKVSTSIKTRQEKTAFYHQAIMNNHCRWCVVSIPTMKWAKKVFQNDNGNTAYEKLWSSIFKAARVDIDNPIDIWYKHNKTLKEKVDRLNDKKFLTLKYSNSLGTNLEVGMPEGHLWSGGSEVAQDGIEFFPNIPTEEVFSAPHRLKVNGIVKSSLPLIYNGQFIDDFMLEFKDGKVIRFSATSGEEALSNLLNENDTSSYLGEIALVPYSSPISDMEILFYNTLFDENASCHFALGAAYPNCIENGEQMSESELMKVGLNQSPTHVDFMIGTQDLVITGIEKNGNETLIFENGNWNPEL